MRKEAAGRLVIRTYGMKNERTATMTKNHRSAPGRSFGDNPARAGKPGNSGKSGRGTGMVRIIGGRFRGRRLPVLDSEGLRPTTDRVKETLFNWLMFQIAGTSCLDLFSGSGSLGFEAWSRGAARVVMLEMNRQVCLSLKKNAALLASDTGEAGTSPEIIGGDALSWLGSYRGEPFDIIFLDPPFRKGILEEVFALLPGVVRKDGFVYVEQESESAIRIPSFLTPYREGRAGQVVFRLFRMGDPA